MTHDHERHFPLWLSYALAVSAGVAMTTQAHINSLLGASLDNGIVAAALSFAGGFIVLIGMGLISRKVRAAVTATRQAISRREITWGFTFAGIAGAAFVFSQSTVSPVIGLALFSVSFVCGLTIGGLLMDVWGIGPAGHRPITPLRIAGAALAVVAVAISVSGHIAFDQASGFLTIPAACGVGVSWQQAANGRLTQVNKNPWSTTLINFGVGFGILMLGVIVVSLVGAFPTQFPANPWLYVGGPVGIAFIAIASVVVRYIGILIYGLCATTGQLVSAVAIDSLDPASHGVSVSVIIGAIVVALGTALASLSGAWAKRSR